MQTDKIKWHGYDNYNLNCTFKDLEENGFVNSSYHNDLAPSYMNKKKNIQVFFIDVESDEMKAESLNYKFSIMALDEHGEYEKSIATTSDFDSMLKIVKMFEDEEEENSEYWKHYDERNKMNNDETYKSEEDK